MRRLQTVGKVLCVLEIEKFWIINLGVEKV